MHKLIPHPSPRKNNVLARVMTLPLLFFYFIALFSHTALAATPEDLKYLHAPFFSETVCSPTSQSSGGNVTLVGSDNLEKIYTFFLGQGLEAHQAAGIAGNAQAESGGDPAAVSRSGYRGIFQWDAANRWPRLVAWAGQQDPESPLHNPQTLESQLGFALHEANERGNMEGIRQQPTADLAAWYWGRFYEVAIIGGSTSTTPMTNVQMLEERVGFANEILRLYGGSTAGQTSSSGSSCGGVGTGQDSQFVDGFRIYNQYDPAWRDLPYSSSTIGTSGCGPAALAMVITALTRREVTPVDTAAYAAERGLYVAGQGSSWNISPVLAEHWGLQSEQISNDVAAITLALQEGKLIVAPGQGPKPFTSGGHFIVIRAVTADGKWRVGDSGHSDTSDKDWEPEQIVSNMRDGGAYAIFR